MPTVAACSPIHCTSSTSIVSTFIAVVTICLDAAALAGRTVTSSVRLSFRGKRAPVGRRCCSASALPCTAVRGRADVAADSSEATAQFFHRDVSPAHGGWFLSHFCERSRGLHRRAPHGDCNSDFPGLVPGRSDVLGSAAGRFFFSSWNAGIISSQL